MIIKLIEYLFSKDIIFAEDEKSIICNGCRVIYDDEYIITSLTTNKRITSVPIYTPEKVLEYLLRVPETLPQKITFILSDKSHFNIRKNQFLSTLERNTALISQILTQAHYRRISYERCVNDIEDLIDKNLYIPKNTTDNEYIKLKPYQVFEDVILPLPLNPNFIINNSVTIIDFVIHETLVSCGGIVKPCLKMAKDGIPDIYPFQLELKIAYSNSVYHALHKDTILNSPFKLKIFHTVLYLLSKGNNFKYIKTENESIWRQISWIYSFDNKCHMSLLPEQFKEKLKGFSLVS